jgi:hypothetical protein
MYNNYLNDDSDIVYNKIKEILNSKIFGIFNFEIIYFLILVYFIYIILLRKKINNF